VEGYFSIFKRGMIGTYQHCCEQHLQRYLHEFDFRYSNRKISDAERAELAVVGGMESGWCIIKLVSGPKKRRMGRTEFRKMKRFEIALLKLLNLPRDSEK
jgi:hypothetical protein